MAKKPKKIINVLKTVVFTILGIGVLLVAVGAVAYSRLTAKDFRAVVFCESAQMVALRIWLGADVIAVDGHDRTPLEYAFEGGSQRAIRQLSSDPGVSVLDLVRERESDASVVELLIKAGADLDRVNAQGRTALFRAVQRSKIEVVGVMLAAGADPNHADKDGNTPLIFACQVGACMAKTLISAGADVNAANHNGETPLMLACAEGSLELVNLYLDAGAAVDVADTEGNTPASRAIESDNARSVVRDLFSKSRGSGVKPSDDLLCYAVTLGKFGAAEELVRAGADVHAQTGGMCALLLALDCECPVEFTKMLIDRGADVNACVRSKGAKAGRTPLMMAVAYKDGEDVVDALLRAGADATAMDHSGRSAIDHAREINPDLLPILKLSVVNRNR